MSEPKRIQRKRTKGWKMPEGAVYVGRPTKWGNPFAVGAEFSADEAVEKFRTSITVGWNKKLLGDLAELRGRDLACWCPPDKPCHADVLLGLANPCQNRADAPSTLDPGGGRG